MRVLLICYKIEAGKRGEDGGGDNIASRLIERGHEVTLLSRRNNIALLAKDPRFDPAHLEGVDVPRVIGFFKRRARGIILYYYLWQLAVSAKVRWLQRRRTFDVIH